MTGILESTATRELLSSHTSFRIGGPADRFLRPAGLDALMRAVTQARSAGMPVRVIGQGTNLLVDDGGVDGMVIATGSLGRAERAGDGIVDVECGVKLPWLVARSAEWGLSGIECLAGIPGSVGGAVRTNAGAASGCIADVIEHIRVLTPDGEQARLTPAEADLGYRRANIGGAVVLSVRLRLRPADGGRVRAAAAENLRRKAQAQPLSAACAGCVFKNPPGDSAGRIIDSLGLKGAAAGGARISEKHANFIVNDGGATAADVLALIDLARDTARRALGVALELEIDVWRRTARDTVRGAAPAPTRALRQQG